MWFAFLCLWACEKETACERAAKFDPSLELGLGLEAFEALSNDDAVQREYGAQGGSHLWIAVRATGLALGSYSLLAADEPAPVTHVSLLLASDVTTVTGTGEQSNVPWTGDESQAETVGIQLFLESGDTGYSPTTTTSTGDSAAMILDATVTDACSTEISRQVSLRLQ